MVYSKQKFHPGSLDLRRVAWWKLSLQKYTFFNIQTLFDNFFQSPTTIQPTSKCTIPFGHPAQPETTRISDTHRNNEKDRHWLAKRNLGLARTGINERAASPPVPALARRGFRFSVLS